MRQQEEHNGRKQQQSLAIVLFAGPGGVLPAAQNRQHANAVNALRARRCKEAIELGHGAQVSDRFAPHEWVRSHPFVRPDGWPSGIRPVLGSIGPDYGP